MQRILIHSNGKFCHLQPTPYCAGSLLPLTDFKKQ